MAVLTLLAIAAVAQLAAQAVLTGTVRDESTGKPLGGVEVVIERTVLRALTDPSGKYSFTNTPAGRFTVLFRSVGYMPVREFVVLKADTVWANQVMAPSTLRLDSVFVTAKPAGPRGLGLEAFEERRAMGFGRFIDSLELRRSEHLRTPDLLRRIQGITVAPSGSKHIAVSNRRAGPDGQRCPMAVFLDGVAIYKSEAPVSGPGGGPPRIPPPQLEDFQIANLAAVEVYRSAGEVPIEFSGAGSACGALVLWTRR